MKRTLVIICLLALSRAALAQNRFDGTPDRGREILHVHVDDPYPDPSDANPNTRAWGKTTFALAAYATGRELHIADRFVTELREEFPVPLDDSFSFPTRFCLPLLWRMYLDPALSPRMSEGARAAIEEMMWRFLFHRSKTSDAQDPRETILTVHQSENLDLMSKTGYLLATQALRDHPGYSGAALADGNSLSDHCTAWTAYFEEQMRHRAMHGTHCEIGSPTYAKYTLHAYYNLFDYTESAILKRLTRDFITLYWAEVAQLFLDETGVRGGAQTRVYKDKSMTRGSRFSLRDWTWAYGWHDDAPDATHPMTAAMATSRYRVPPIVKAIATSDKPPFQLASRRFGMGFHHGQGDTYAYTLEFDGGTDAHLMHDSWVAPEHVLGAMTVDPAREYTNLNGQNRWMGMIASTHPDARLAVVGRGEPEGGGEGRKGYHEIQGVLQGPCMIVGRDPGAHRSIGTDIYVSHAGGLLNQWQNDGDWFFTRTGDTFVAVRIATGAFQVDETEDGAFLRLTEMHSPVVMEVGRSKEYGLSFAGEEDRYRIFRQSVKSNFFEYDGDRLTYVSERGDRFEFFPNSTRLPRINGADKNLTPELSIRSPYVTSWAGSDTVTIRFPGFRDRILSFSY